MSENGETVDNSALDAIQRRLLELSELFPLTFWKNLDRLNVQEQRTPRWSFLINSNGIQCNIYWENKTEQEKLEEDALLGGEALKRAEKWLQDAQNAGGDENLSQDEINKTVQSILSFFSPLNNNNTSQSHNRRHNTSDDNNEKTADGLLKKLKTKLIPPDASKKRKSAHHPKTSTPPPPKMSRKIVVGQMKVKHSDLTQASGAAFTKERPLAPKKSGNITMTSQPLLTTVQKPPGATKQKILCYMPPTLNKNFTVKILKPEKPPSQVHSPVFHIDNNSSVLDSDPDDVVLAAAQFDDHVIKVEPFDGASVALDDDDEDDGGDHHHGAMKT